MGLIVDMPVVEIVDSWSVQNKDQQSDFYITRATLDDVDEIIYVVQETYYQPDIEVLQQRDFSLKAEFGLVDVPRRIKDSGTYTVLVCKVRGEYGDRAVGTVYYQPIKTDYRDENGDEVAELGLLAVDPVYTKVNNIGLHLIRAVEALAIQDNKRGIYLLAKGAKVT